MADCSKTEEFLKGWKKMCIKGEANCGIRKQIDSCLDCQDYACNNPQEAINIMQQWSDERPPKTRQSEFLKMFPRSRVTADGTLDLLPCSVDTELKDRCDEFVGCYSCGRAYWLEEVD